MLIAGDGEKITKAYLIRNQLRCSTLCPAVCHTHTGPAALAEGSEHVQRLPSIEHPLPHRG